MATKCTKVRVSNLSPGPGTVGSEIWRLGGFTDGTENVPEKLPHLMPADVADAVVYMLSTLTNVNVTQLSISSTGEAF